MLRWFSHQQRGALLQPLLEKMTRLQARFLAISINESAKPTFAEMGHVGKAKKPEGPRQLTLPTS